MRTAAKRFSRLVAATLAVALALPAAAVADASRPPTPFGGFESGREFLEIPGFGRIPIPAIPSPPRFPPIDAPRKSGAEPRPPVVEAPRDRASVLNALFARLSAAESAEESQAVAGSIGRLWARSGSPSADLLLERAARAASSGELRLALDLFDHIVTLEPGWPEGFVARANARIIVGDDDGASRDFEIAIGLEPRRFDALGSLGALQERAGAANRALHSYRKALSLDPRRDDWRKAEERLTLEVEGRDI